MQVTPTTPGTAVTASLRTDHLRLDALLKEAIAALARNDARPATATFGAFASGLRRHIEVEDELLFPPFERRTGMRDAGPTNVMRRDHKDIERRLTSISAALHDGLLPVSVGGEMRALAALLDDHNVREEEILYPWCDRVLDESERAAVSRRLSSPTL